jgi:hypothetical protein
MIDDGLLCRYLPESGQEKRKKFTKVISEIKNTTSLFKEI